MAYEMLKTPIFAKVPTLSVLEAAVSEGGKLFNIDRIAYVFVEDTRILYHVSITHELSPIAGEHQSNVVRLDQLPNPESADKETLYLIENDIYTFDGTDFHLSYANLQTGMDNLAYDVLMVSEKLENLSYYTVQESIDKKAEETIAAAEEYTDNAMTIQII